MIIAGDVSGDKHVGLILDRLKTQAPGLEIIGCMGGERMVDAGIEVRYDLRDLNVIGIVEIIRYLPRIKAMQEKIFQMIVDERPEVLFLVDFGGFNLPIARRIRKLFPEQKIVFFISPQVWASRPWRIKTVAKNVSKMLVIFPFEEELYKAHGVEAKFIGHPLTQQIPHKSELIGREEFAARHGLDPQRPIVAILPGSRRTEIKEHLGMCLQAVKELYRDRPGTQFVVSKAGENLNEDFEAVRKQSNVEKSLGRDLIFLSGKENYNLFNNADVVWAKSGTTTLEVALFGKPMLIFYRGNWLTWSAVMLAKTVKNVGLPNILAGRTLVPELLQLDCRPQQLVRYTRDMLDVPGLRREYAEQLAELRNSLGQNDYITACTNEVLETLGVPI